MKRVLIGADGEELLSTLEVILKHWGYRVTVSSSERDLMGLLGELSYDLVILETHLAEKIGKTLSEKSPAFSAPLILLKSNDTPLAFDIPHIPLNVPVNIFSLFSLIQTHLERQPRQNLRLTVRLPGMFSTGEDFSLAEVLSLSSRGLFIKTGTKLETGSLVRVAIPLMGMKRELDITGKILYHIDPGPANNYSQGYGIEFTDLDASGEEILKRYIETSFFGEIAGKRWGVTDMSWDQLTDIPRELGLYLIQTT